MDLIQLTTGWFYDQMQLYQAFGYAWDKVNLVEKFCWLFFLSHTIAAITLFEMVLFR